MRDGLKKAGLFHLVPSAAWQKAWVVHSKSVGYGEKAVAYLADYVFRIGLSNTCIVKLEQGEVTFWYMHSGSKRRVSVTLPVFEFIDRFLLHVLPQGFVKVRYYGFYAPSNRHRLALARELLGADASGSHNITSESPAAAWETTDPEDSLSCPRCGEPLRLLQRLRPQSRSPPAGAMGGRCSWMVSWTLLLRLRQVLRQAPDFGVSIR